jgi:hypothetical protein
VARRATAISPPVAAAELDTAPEEQTTFVWS